MEKFSRKIYLSLKMPTEEAPISDEKRIRLALEALGYEHVTIGLSVLRSLYPPMHLSAQIPDFSGVKSWNWTSMDWCT